jgi:uncharacterized cupin superfamily protein
MIAGFPACVANGHHLVNEGAETATYLEIGDRDVADEVFYPDIDMELRQSGDGRRLFLHRDGSQWNE